MKCELIFQNPYYPWIEIHINDTACWLKGNIFYDNKTLREEDVIRLFSSFFKGEQIDHETLKNFLLELNGNFAIAMETSRYIFCMVDRVRSIPLFYATDKDGAIFSDDANYIRDRLNPPFCEENGAEFLVTGYVTSNETLFDGIFQVQAGEYLIFDKITGNFSNQLYHHFWHRNFFTDSEEDLLNRLDNVFVHIFQRLIASTKGYQIVVPLSGGLDSRIIVAMLKRLGVKDVFCFSYGRKGNYESNISKKVAESLGYQWEFVEYSNQRWFNFYHSDEMRIYEQYAGNLTSVPVIQDFLAVQILKENGKIPYNAVFIPGHSGDMLAGSWIPYDISNIPHNYDQFFEHILRRHYSLRHWEGKREAEFNLIFREKIKKSIGNIEITDLYSFMNALEYFNFNERQAKFIVNSIRAYEYLGYEWRIPLWDNELIDFFLSLKINYRVRQNLYKKYIFNFLLKKYLPCLLEIPSNNTSSDNNFFIDNYVTKKLLDNQDLKQIAIKIYYAYKFFTEYYKNSCNFYGIMSKAEYFKIYRGFENINTYLSNDYLKNTLKLENPHDLFKDI